MQFLLYSEKRFMSQGLEEMETRKKKDKRKYIFIIIISFFTIFKVFSTVIELVNIKIF